MHRMQLHTKAHNKSLNLAVFTPYLIFKLTCNVFSGSTFVPPVKLRQAPILMT